MNVPVASSGAGEMVVLIRAAYQFNPNPAERLFCAGITPEGEWVRFSPIPKAGITTPALKRWERIRFQWQTAKGDARPESRKVDLGSIERMGELPHGERSEWVKKALSAGLNASAEKGRTVAIVKARKPLFFVQRKTENELLQEQLEMQNYMPVAAAMVDAPFPYKFRYRYTDDAGEQEIAYQDWDMRDTLTNLAKSFGSAQALARVIQLWGKDYPQKGMYFTISRDELTSPFWCINTILLTDEVEDMSARAINLIA